MTTYRAFDRTRGWNAFSRFIDDFTVYAPGATNWVATLIGAGSAAVQDANGGILLLTNAAADNDGYQAQWAKEIVALAAGKKTLFSASFKISDAVQSDILLGLAVLDTTLLGGVADGVYFRKDDGDAILDMVVKSSGTGGASEVASAFTIANDTWYTVEIYDAGDAAGTGRNTIDFYVNSTRIGSVPTTNRPVTELTPSFAFLNGEAVAKTMSLDYVEVRRER